uniref:Uncharacterized protein n=1 Tax=Kalanchoe fedtschenkoi TaxID=63787 RepID=A0A7N0TS54_KALFE
MLCSTGIKPAGTGGGVITDYYKTDRVSAGRPMEGPEFSRVEFSMEDRPEYLFRRELSGKGWKPSLDTITEKIAEQKVTHWLYH